MKAQTVWFDDGVETEILSLVKSTNEDGTLDLVTFPLSSPVEHCDSIPEGTGGMTWHQRV